jgi:uncharacterized protein
MSKTFVKDPRAVVKLGDLVHVKVLEVYKPCKRIALTLRFDDEAGNQAVRTGRAEGGRPDAGGASRRDQARVQAAKPSAPGNAMADALRRAGLAAGKGTR